MQKKGMNVPKVSEPNADDFAGALPQEVESAPEFENQPPPIEKVVEAMFFVGEQTSRDSSQGKPQKCAAAAAEDHGIRRDRSRRSRRRSIRRTRCPRIRTCRRIAW